MLHGERPTAWVTIFLPFALGYYLSYLLRTVNAVISLDLTNDLGLAAADLGLLTSAYFLAFGVVQIPLGIALDRYGPKRVEGALLLLAAIGAAAFALGESLGQLGIARALIGLGVSACLMAGLKGFAMWYPTERQSSMTGYIMAAGAMGALTASTPLEALLPILGWRGIFWGIALVAAGVSVFIFLTLPGDARHDGKETIAQAFRSVGHIFAAPAFLRFAGAAMFFTGGFMALQSLWAVPWLMNVDGMSRASAAGYLMTLNVGMLAGQLSIGMLGTRLNRQGVTPLKLIQVGFSLMLAVQICILMQWGPVMMMWFLLGLLSSVNAQAYIACASSFQKEAFGRVSTAINLMAFLGAFIVQWGFGLILDLLRSLEWTMVGSLKATYLMLLILQAVALVPLLVSRHGGR